MGRETYFPQSAILVPERQSCACLRGQYTLRKIITRHSNHVPRLNLHSPAAPPVPPLPAISCLGAFWTPAATARGRVRHAGVQKPAHERTHGVQQRPTTKKIVVSFLRCFCKASLALKRSS